jgi:predicted nucleotidyltransferase
MESKEIADIVASYCAERPEIVACYLFGSQATGKARPDSDVDLGFLLKNEVPRSHYADLSLEYFSQLSKMLRRDIHPLIMNSAGELVLEQIFRKGMSLYGGDSFDCAYFRMTQTAQIAEFAPLRKRMEDNFLERMKEKYSG